MIPNLCVRLVSSVSERDWHMLARDLFGKPSIRPGANRFDEKAF